VSAFRGHPLSRDEVRRKITEGENYYYERGNYDEAKDCFYEIIDLTNNPSSPEVWSIRGKAYHYLNNYYEAIRCFDEALSDNLEYLEPLFSKALSLRRLGKPFFS
jgi:tetratricopeptide (TPR) repeat protein